MKRLSVKPISFAPVVEAVVNKKRQLAGYIAPSYNAQPYEDFVTSPDAQSAVAPPGTHSR